MHESLQEPIFKEIVGYMSGEGDQTTLWERELTHPTEAYSSEENHDAERRLILSNPVIVGHSTSLKNPGDFIAHSDCGVPLLVVKQKDGTVRAFINSCRHRGAKVCLGDEGNARAFTCRYHNWTYGQDGALKRVPRDGFPNVSTAEFGLIELPCETRHGLIWVVPTEGLDIDVAEFLGPLDEEFAQYPLDEFVLERSELFEEGLNWKFILDGFLEIYHIPALHRDSIAPTFHGRYSPFDVFGTHSRLIGVRKSLDAVKDKSFEEVGSIMDDVAVNYQLFPNTILVWQGDHFEVWTAYPGATPRDCRIRIMSLVKPEHASEKYQRRWDANWEILVSTVRGEDWAACHEVQDALPFIKEKGLLFGRNEPGMQHFHSVISSEVKQMGLRSEEQGGEIR